MYDAAAEMIYLGSLTLSASSAPRTIEAGDNERLIVEDILYRVTTTTAGDTNTPGFKVGNAGDDDKLVTAGYVGAITADTTIRSFRKQHPDKFVKDAVLENGDDMLITAIAAAGTGAAGVLEVWAKIRRG